MAPNDFEPFVKGGPGNALLLWVGAPDEVLHLFLETVKVLEYFNIHELVPQRARRIEKPPEGNRALAATNLRSVKPNGDSIDLLGSAGNGSGLQVDVFGKFDAVEVDDRMKAPLGKDVDQHG